jgi:tripartite-type tricarboxylate transporter receptor subunit TctC
VIAGHVDATVSDVGVFLPFHRENRMRIVMLTSEKRQGVLPDVQTANEEYPGLIITNWIGLFGPAKMPEAIVEKINMALQKMITLPDVRTQFARSMITPGSLPSTQAFKSFVASEYQRYGQILRERNITIS